MIRKPIVLSAILIASALIQSCTIAKISGKGAVPVVMNQPSEKMELLEHVTIKKNSNFDFTNSFDVSEILSKKVAEKKPDAVINTTVILKSSIDNFFLNLVTFGFANSKKVVIDADFMKEKSSITNK